MTENNLDCDTYACPLYDGKHGCKKEVVQIRDGQCVEYTNLQRNQELDGWVESLDGQSDLVEKVEEPRKPLAVHIIDRSLAEGKEVKIPSLEITIKPDTPA